MINFAKFLGYEYQGIDDNNRMVVSIGGIIVTYKLLHVLEFSSARKRMSVILEKDDGQVVLYCKGADSILLKRMKLNKYDFS